MSSSEELSDASSEELFEDSSEEPFVEETYSIEKAFHGANLKVRATSHSSSPPSSNPSFHLVELELCLDSVSPTSLEKLLSGNAMGRTPVSESCYLQFMLEEAGHVLYNVPSKISVKAGSIESLAEAFKSSLDFIQNHLGDPLVKAGLRNSDFNPNDISSMISYEELLSHSSQTLPPPQNPVLSKPRERIVIGISGNPEDEQEIEMPVDGPVEGDTSSFSETVKYLLSSVPLFDASKIYFHPMTNEMYSYLLRAKTLCMMDKFKAASRDLNRAVTICDFLLDNMVGSKSYDDIHPLELLFEDGFIPDLLVNDPQAAGRLYPDYKEERVLMDRISLEIIRAQVRIGLARKNGKIKNIPSYIALSQDFLDGFIERYYNPGKITFFADPRLNMGNMDVTDMDGDSPENSRTITLNPSFADALFHNKRSEEKISVYVSLRNLVRLTVEKLGKGSGALPAIAGINPSIPCLTLDERIRVLQKKLDVAQERKQYDQAQKYQNFMEVIQTNLIYAMREDPLGFTTSIM